MKKFLLSIVFALISFATIMAVDLNPFAYNLYTSKEASGHTKLHFYLNAPANRVRVIIMNGAEEYILREYTNVAYHPNGYGTVITDNDINNLNLQPGINYSWKVVVFGTSQTSPKLTTQAIPFYCPHALAIDNNPNSKHFGRVLVAESRHGASSSGCISSVNGTIKGGIYALRPELEYTDGGTVYTSWYDPNNHVFTGGKDFTRQIVKDGVLHLDNNSGLQPYMVRISDDGRIFVSSGDARADGCVVWELDPDNLNNWTDLIKGNLKPYQGEDLTLPASNGIYQVFDANGNFVAGLNCSMDVKGSGENLKLALYSTDKRGMTKFVVENFRLHEYAIGNSKTFTGTPTHIPHFGKTRYGHINSHAKLFYDGDNGFWFGGYNSAGDDDIIFAHARKSGNDYIRKSWGDNSNTYFGGAGVKTHVLHNGEEILFKGVNNNKLLFYKVDRSTGIPVLTSKSWGFSLSNLANARCNDFVVDYADNLYLVDNNNEQLMTVALPYSGIVSTPAASNYNFEISCNPGTYYTVNTHCYPAEGGSVTCTMAGNTRAAGVLNVESCTKLTLTATPGDNYKFTKWTNANGDVISNNPEYTFYVTQDVTLTANFEYANYTGVTWWNLFKNGEDIADESASHPGTNERLWRLLQVEYGNTHGISVTDYPDHTTSNVVSGSQKYLLSSKQLNVLGFDNNHDGSIKNFIATNSMFLWLGEYILDKAHNLSQLNQGSGWAYYTYMFMNRTDYAMGWVKSGSKYVGEISNWAFNGTNGASTGYGNNDIVWDSFITYGKPEHWRPYWTEGVCNLPRTMKYSDEMPIFSTWATNRPNCPSDSIAGVIPSDWFQWNDPPADTKINKYILAWRDGSTTGPIVHHVSKNNMKLFASYVKKNIEENDTINPSLYEASNDDVIQLMANKRFGNVPTHDLTVTRYLVANMYNTICLPFGVDLTGLMEDHPLKYKANGTGATVLEFTGVTRTKNDAGEDVTILNFQQVTSTQAGKPYLVKLRNGATDLTEDMLFTTVSSYPDLHSVTHGGITFHPTINATTVPAEALILVANDRLAQTTEEGEMLGLRGYFTIDPMWLSDISAQAADGRVYLSMKKPVTTSIPVAPEAEQQLKPEVRKVMYDGQIYILRGGEVYTVTGNKVK